MAFVDQDSGKVGRASDCLDSGVVVRARRKSVIGRAGFAGVMLCWDIGSSTEPMGWCCTQLDTAYDVEVPDYMRPADLG